MGLAGPVAGATPLREKRDHERKTAGLSLMKCAGLVQW